MPNEKKRKYFRKCGVCDERHEQSEMIRTEQSPNGWICHECYCAEYPEYDDWGGRIKMPNELKPCLMFIELTDSYDGKSFCLNINFIKTVRNNGRYAMVTTADTQYSVYESYDEIVKKIKRAAEAWNRRVDNG